MFEVYSDGCSLFNIGISCISVGGKCYAPFVKLACSLGIPTFIVSDNDGTTKAEIDKQIKKIEKEIDHPLGADVFGISYCSSSNDFEAELLNVLKLRDEINEALVLYETNATDNCKYKAAKEAEIKALNDGEILTRMRDAKTSYSGFLSDVIKQSAQNGKLKEQLITQAAVDAFSKIKGWIPA
jgi:putative ATP-dependent endonuclease of OLD family